MPTVAAIVLDGDYRRYLNGRGGFAVTHVGDKSCRNYAVQATFDITNPAGLPSTDVHNAFFLFGFNRCLRTELSSGLRFGRRAHLIHVVNLISFRFSPAVSSRLRNR